MPGAWHLQRQAESSQVAPRGRVMHRLAGTRCNPRCDLWRCPQPAVWGRGAQSMVEFLCCFCVEIRLGARSLIALLVRHSFRATFVVAACKLCDPTRGAPHPAGRTVSLLALRDQVEDTPPRLLLRALASSITMIKFFCAQVWLE